MPILLTPITLLKSSVVQWGGRAPAPVAPSQMIVNPVFGSRAIFDQSLQGSPMAGVFATAEVVAGGVVAVGGGGTTGAGVGEIELVGCTVVVGVVDGAVAVWWLCDSWMPTKMSDPVSKSATTAAIILADRAHDSLEAGAETGEVFGDAASGGGAVTPASVLRSRNRGPLAPSLRALANWRHRANRSAGFFDSAVVIASSRFARSGRRSLSLGGGVLRC